MRVPSRAVQTLLAAGGLVTRHNELVLEVLLVHRPKSGDWSIPKGKWHVGETLEQCALREVEEETGYRCELGRELGAVSYRDRRGRSKAAYYWEMDPISGEFEPNREVDRIRWLPLTEAGRALTRARERPIIAALLALEAVPLLI